MTAPIAALSAAVIIGPSQHGVVMLARRLSARNTSIRILAEPDVAAFIDRSDLRCALADVQSVHVHFTDQLFGAQCEQSVIGFARLLAALRSNSSAVVSVTLHDVPMTSELTSAATSARYARRAAAYAAVIGFVDGRVIVNSAHEARAAGRFADLDFAIIPLPIDAPRPHIAPGNHGDAAAPEIAIMGFIYPGKGHEQVLRALALLPASVGLTALGRTAVHHDSMADDLVRLAASIGRRFTVTGFLSEFALANAMRAATVPLAAHQHISASASIGTWLEAGRRPLVPDEPWTRELHARCPGSLSLYTPTTLGLAHALTRALGDPASTWLDASVRLGPDTAEVVAMYADAARHCARPGWLVDDCAGRPG